tara:strand:+ start:42 stop:581 length:540 start_codon:yes stop_codon:yes gene_type:complete
MNKAQQIVGFSANREKNDFYATPEESTEKLLRVVTFRGRIYEPCCGQGHISEVLIKHGYEVFSSDLVDRGYGTPRVDFLMETQKHDNIVTNPPFKNALEFAERALELSRNKVALLLKLSFLEGVARRNFFKRYPPEKVWVFSQRQALMKNGEPHSGGMLALAWFIWRKGNIESPTIGWV